MAAQNYSASSLGGGYPSQSQNPFTFTGGFNSSFQNGQHISGTPPYSSFGATSSEGMLDPNKIKFPEWLNPSNNGLQELQDQYSKIPGAFDSSGQVKAINDSIANQTDAGMRSGNAAAAAYAQRAQQQGGSALGAEAVGAQAMLPVYQQNAELRSKAADTVASNSQNASKFSSEVAGQLGQIRQKYQGLLADYFNSSSNRELQSSQFNRELGFKQWSTGQQLGQDNAKLALSAAQAAAAAKGPSGQQSIDLLGHPLDNPMLTTANQHFQDARNSGYDALARMAGRF